VRILGNLAAAIKTGSVEAARHPACSSRRWLPGRRSQRLQFCGLWSNFGHGSDL